MASSKVYETAFPDIDIKQVLKFSFMVCFFTNICGEGDTSDV